MSYPDNPAPLAFGQAVSSVFRQYAGFRGRARRSEYWYFFLFNVLVSIVIGVLDLIIGSFIPGAVLSLAVLIPSLAVSVRRLHDTGRSGWNLLWQLIPLVGTVVVIVFQCQDSERADNRFGPSPKYGPSPSGVSPTTGGSVSTGSSTGAAPWITGGVAGFVCVVLVVLFVHVHSVSEHHAARAKQAQGLTADQQAAVTAAATEAANVVTFSRKTFDADFTRALNGATGKLKSDLSGEKALTLNTLTSGKFDLKGTVGSSAFEGVASDGKSLLALVTVNGFKVADAANSSSSSVQRLELTMTKVGNVWLASSLSAVGVQ